MRTSLLALLLAASASAQSTVVFGNLGSDGSFGLDETNTDVTNTNRLAVGFNTGSSSSLFINSITIGAFVGNTNTYLLTLYAGSSTAPNLNSVVAYSAGLELNANDSGKFTYSFAELELAANTTYWVVPTSGQSWYAPSPAELADEQNLSGYSFIGNRRSTNSGVSWNTYFVPYSISIQASAAPIPEPSTYGLILGGLALAGAAIRRRQKAAK